METTVKTDSDKIKAIVGMIRYLECYTHYYSIKGGYENKLLSIFSDGSNHDMLLANMARCIRQHPDIFSLYGLRVLAGTPIYYSGKLVYW